MNWTAPEPAPSLIKFNAAFNAANGNGANTGDQIYTSFITVNEFQLNPQLTGVEPNHAQQGFEGELTISGQDTEWTLGVDEVRFELHDDNDVYFIANQITVVLDELITVSVSIPPDTEIGSYDVRVDELELENGFVVDVIDEIADNYLADAVSIYPNPATDNVIVTAPTGSQVVIADIAGRRVSEYKIVGTTIDINVSSYNSGLYFVQITHDGVAFSGKLIKR